jgi:cyclase
VLAIDARRKADGSGWEVFTHGGRKPTGLDAVAWAVEGVQRGAGEILLTSMDATAPRTATTSELTRAVSESVGVPVIASGGAGTLQHLVEAVTEGQGRRRAGGLDFPLWRIYHRPGQVHMKERGVVVRT